MNLSGILLAFLLVASGCGASAKSTQARQSSPERTYDCNYETPTGSNIQKLDCRTLQREDEERAEAQQRLREMQMHAQPIQQ